MHELSIALSILDIVADEASRQGHPRVLAVHVRIGPLSGVLPNALLAAFDLAREGTAFKDAQLVIEETSIVLYCGACRAERPARSVQQLCCAHCGAAASKFVTGLELDVTSVEIDA